MDKITEMIPDDMPGWAKEAMNTGCFFRETLNRIQQLEEQLGKRKKFKFVKQNDGHSCYACCAAMATGQELQDVVDFIGHDGKKFDPKSKHPDKMVGYSLEELNLYLASHGLTFGAVGINAQGFNIIGIIKSYTHFKVEVAIDDFAAIVIVKSLRFKDIRHALYWDGKSLWDPNVGKIRLFKKYDLLEWWPLFDFRKD